MLSNVSIFRLRDKLISGKKVQGKKIQGNILTRKCESFYCEIDIGFYSIEVLILRYCFS